MTRVQASRYGGFREHENGSHPAELRLSGQLLIRRETGNLAAGTPSFQVSDFLVYQALVGRIPGGFRTFSANQASLSLKGGCDYFNARVFVGVESTMR